MSQQPSQPADRIPRWAMWTISLAIAFHLMAIVGGALAASSGPWPTMEGPNMGTPPQLANSLNNSTRDYLKLIKMTHNYHFLTNNPGTLAASFEVVLKNEEGEEIATLQFPDPNANRWVRHRQSLLAHALTNDQPVPPPASEEIAPPSKAVETVLMWEGTDDRHGRLKRVPKHLVPRDQPVQQPSDWVMLLTHSYARYLCRTHGAAKAELIRHSRGPIYPSILFEKDTTQFTEPQDLISNFGELPR